MRLRHVILFLLMAVFVTPIRAGISISITGTVFDLTPWVDISQNMYHKRTTSGFDYSRNILGKGLF